MDRVGLAAAGVLLVAIAGGAAGWYLFLDAPAVTPSELEATPPTPTVETAPPAFTMTASVEARAVDGGPVRANWSAGVAYDGATGERLGWLHTREVSIVEYQRREANATYTAVRYHADDPEAFDRRVASVREDLAAGATLDVNATAQTYESHRVGARGEFAVVPDRLPPFGFLRQIPFERAGTTTYAGETVERYLPVDGWIRTPGSVDDRPDAYVSATGGMVAVSPASGNLVRANVTFTERRADVRAGRWLGEGGTRTRVRLRGRESVDGELAPGWASAPAVEGG